MRTLPLALAAAIPCTRQYDLILVGSTGFTGKLASKYLASRLTNWLPKHDSNHRQVSWAISGRSKIDLENLQAELATMPSACLPDVILADLVVDGVEGLQEKIAAKSRVVLSTAGPFAKYGNDLVAACVTSGTDYCDITGEVDWVRGLIRLHDDAARKTGARVVPFCGHDSVPWDLLTLAVASRLRTGDTSGDTELRGEGSTRKQEEENSGGGSGSRTPWVSECLSKISFEDDVRATASGGSIATIYHATSKEAGSKESDEADLKSDEDPLLWTPPSTKAGSSSTIRSSSSSSNSCGHRRVHGPSTEARLPLLPRWSSTARAGRGSWVGPFLMATVNAKAVKRSNALLAYSSPPPTPPLPTTTPTTTTTTTTSPASLVAFAAAPPPLVYEECRLHDSFAAAASDVASLAVFALSFSLAPLRALLRRMLPAPGDGPSTEQMAQGHLRIRAVGAGASTGALVEANLSFEDDPGYRETARMLSEAALCMLEDRLNNDNTAAAAAAAAAEAEVAVTPIEGGVLTPASCMGLRLLDRLCETGSTFSISGPRAAEGNEA